MAAQGLLLSLKQHRAELETPGLASNLGVFRLILFHSRSKEGWSHMDSNTFLILPSLLPADCTQHIALRRRRSATALRFRSGWSAFRQRQLSCVDAGNIETIMPDNERNRSRIEACGHGVQRRSAMIGGDCSATSPFIAAFKTADPAWVLQIGASLRIEPRRLLFQRDGSRSTRLYR